VANIQEIADMIGKLCPNVTVGVAHGQMEGTLLEDTLLDFINGEFDVLVATNIIESGLDIPNANTIIINQAQNFGLSDLHQMRGRVGRSNIKAYCYLVIPPLSTLSDEARKRLQAIETFSDLGSGFNVALRDLDIRGAGNLLGGEQSGFINEIGFEMYHKILEEAMLELQEDEEYKGLFADQPHRPYVKDCLIETDFEALLPDKYVSSPAERLNLYLELDNTNTDEGLQRFVASLTDRFGAPPAAALALIDIVRLRWAAKALGFEKLLLKNGAMKGYLVDGKNEKFYQSDAFGKLLTFVQQNPKTTELKQAGTKIIIDIKNIAHAAQAKDTLIKLFE
jgi:transcription-repair coupling factor (superfamily II helicase)